MAPIDIDRHLTLSPQLCVCVLSHQRLDLLRTTLRAIVSHLETVERGLPYELVWVDNGSNETDRQALHREFRFEKALLLGTNYGMAYGFNSLFFRLCSAPYFLTLEEDWEWLGDGNRVGGNALRDAISVLRHDTGISGVFLRPDTLDQFLKRGPWTRAPRVAVAGGVQGVVDARGGQRTSSSSDDGAADAHAQRGGAVEYAKYCMDRGASYLWGAYSNGPGVYDRSRLMRLVGRQFGEPADGFPDPASESNYAYRVGTAGLCSAVMRIWPGCAGVHECNLPLIRHIGDERSHGYGKGRLPSVRWLLQGSNYSYDRIDGRAARVGRGADAALALAPRDVRRAVGDGRARRRQDRDAPRRRVGDRRPGAPDGGRRARRRARAESAGAALACLRWDERGGRPRGGVRVARAGARADRPHAALRGGNGGGGGGGGERRRRQRRHEAAPPASLAERFARLADATDAASSSSAPTSSPTLAAGGGRRARVGRGTARRARRLAATATCAPTPRTAP